jgi:hypothetical protein
MKVFLIAFGFFSLVVFGCRAEGVGISPTETSTALAVPSPTRTPAQLFSSYEQAREEEPCSRGYHGERVLLASQEFELLCNRVTGDITLLVNPTGNLSTYREVKEKLVEPALCPILSSTRQLWLLWAAVDLETFESQVTFADSSLNCMS